MGSPNSAQISLLLLLSLSILRAMEADTHLCNTISLCDTVPLLPTHLHPKRPFYQIVTSEE